MHHAGRQTNKHSDRKSSYLWIAEPEVQASKVGEKAEAREENPVLEKQKRRKGETNK